MVHHALEVKLKPCVSGTYHGCQTSTLRRKLHMITSTTIRNLQSIILPLLTFNKTNNGFFLLWTETGCADRREKEATGTEASTSQPVAPRYTTRGRSYGRRGLSSWNGGFQWGRYHKGIHCRGHQACQSFNCEFPISHSAFCMFSTSIEQLQVCNYYSLVSSSTRKYKLYNSSYKWSVPYSLEEQSNYISGLSRVSAIFYGIEHLLYMCFLPKSTISSPSSSSTHQDQHKSFNNL